MLKLRITPQSLEVVESPDLSEEDMRYDVHVVKEHPIEVRIPFAVPCLVPELLHSTPNSVGNCLDLGIGVRRADNEEISNRSDSPQVNNDDIRGFFR